MDTVDWLFDIRIDKLLIVVVVNLCLFGKLLIIVFLIFPKLKSLYQTYILQNVSK